MAGKIKITNVKEWTDEQVRQSPKYIDGRLELDGKKHRAEVFYIGGREVLRINGIVYSISTDKPAYLLRDKKSHREL
jgi:hypothetical protein